MKNLLMIFFLCNLIFFYNSIRLPTTPKADSLNNHFGMNPSENRYGPKSSFVDENIPRQGYNKGDMVTPITNFDEEIGDRLIASGSLNNVAKDATKIITPNLDVPSIKIEADLVHNAVVKTPVQIGVQIETEKETVLNKDTGKITKKETTTKKPILAVLETNQEVTTKVNTIVDVATGKVIESGSEKKLLGQDTV